MRNLVLIIACLFISLIGYGQNYIKGIVRNEKGFVLPHVAVQASSTDELNYTDKDGKFVLGVKTDRDSVSFFKEGYVPMKRLLSVPGYHEIVLQKQNPAEKHLVSYIKSRHDDESIVAYGGETYESLIENPVVYTKETSSVSFSVNTNLASYSNIRRFIDMNEHVPPDAVRVEEMLNYFNFNYKEPPAGQTFISSDVITSCPWNNKHQLVFLNVSAKKVNVDSVPPSNLVLLVDVSGSMDLPNKLPLIKSGLRLLVNNLRAIDTVSIVSYGNAVSINAERLSGDQKDSLLKVIEDLDAGGSTPGEAGLRLAYKVAKRRMIAKGNNRIILATDGDFNVGAFTEKDLEQLIEQQEETGIHLTCLGVGMGNFKDSKLSRLALKGQGNFAYLDNEQEAERVLVTELTQTLFTVAENVYLDISFDSTVVQEFRLIGYENKQSAMEDSLAELQGGDIGSGHSIMAVLEIASNSGSAKPIGTVAVHYRMPGGFVDSETRFSCSNHYVRYDSLDQNLKKAINLVMLGMKLKYSAYAKRISWDYIEKNALKVFNSKEPMDLQYQQLVEKARKIYRKKAKF
ncbi:MAG TPA: von Willebrand factor type A domain-containing protein [Flavisolibacter sp.]